MANKQDTGSHAGSGPGSNGIEGAGFAEALLKLEETEPDTHGFLTIGMYSSGARQRIKNRLKAGDILRGKWVILEHINSGGKGDVYVALQTKLKRKVALKVFSPGIEGDQDFIQEELEVEQERFRREVIAMAGIRHKNVIQIYDYDVETQAGRAIEYLTMELIPGSTLRVSMKDEGFLQDKYAIAPWIIHLFLPFLAGVMAIHAAGIIHRDLKPENILLDGLVPKITDFGSARLPLQSGITRSFHILGTLFYMSKEQFEDGGTADVRADVYALGKLLFEAVQGKGANNSNLVFKQARLPLQQYENGEDDFYVRLDEIIRKATTEDPETRTATVDELYNSLNALACLVLSSRESPARCTS